MKIIKFLLLVLILILNSRDLLLGQTIDSIKFKNICPAVKAALTSQYINFNNNDSLFLLLNSDSSNIFKNYSTCFDCIFDLGLNINKPLPKPIPRNSRFTLDSVENARLRMLHNELDPYNVFILFINIKKFYEANFCILSEKLDIPILIKNSQLSYPLSVENVLLCKYRHITKDKMYKDMRLYIKKQ